MGPNCPHITEEETGLQENEHLALPMLMLEAGFIQTPEQVFLIITYISHMLNIYITNNSNHLLITFFVFFELGTIPVHLILIKTLRSGY